MEAAQVNPAELQFSKCKQGASSPLIICGEPLKTISRSRETLVEPLGRNVEDMIVEAVPQADLLRLILLDKMVDGVFSLTQLLEQQISSEQSSLD